jgi:hypothetical protein
VHEVEGLLASASRHGSGALCDLGLAGENQHAFLDGRRYRHNRGFDARRSESLVELCWVGVSEADSSPSRITGTPEALSTAKVVAQSSV